MSTAILSFVAAFFLVRFRLHEAVHKEYEAELSGGSPKVFVGSTSQNPSPRVSISNADPAGTTLSQKSSTEGPTINHIEPPPRMVYSTNPHLEQVGPWRGNAPPMRLLQNCHALCMMLSMVGFVPAIAGAMMYVWTML